MSETQQQRFTLTDELQVMSPLSDEEYAALKAGIEEDGVEDPIVHDEDLVVIDGHHRVRACRELGVDMDAVPTKAVVGLSDDEKREKAYKLNLRRRHLEHGQKQEIVEQYLVNDWTGDRSQTADDKHWSHQIANRLGVGARTVRRAFESLKSSGKLGHLAIFPKGAKKQQAKDYLDEHPDASNREVADAIEADVSYRTVGNWRNEYDWDDGEDESGEEVTKDTPTIESFGRGADANDRATQSEEIVDTATDEDAPDEAKETAQEKAEEVNRGESTPDEAKAEVASAARAARIDELDEELTQSDENSDDSPAFDVSRGEWWELPRPGGEPHLLYCGDTAEEAFAGRVADADVGFAFADPPYNADAAEWDHGFKWDHDYLSDVADVVAVTPGIESIKPFMGLTTMPYEWSVSVWIDNGMTRGALGFGNWIYVALFTQMDSLHRESQDVARVSVRTSESDETDHKGRKPSEMMEWFFERFVTDGGVIVDPFLGSGTTALTAAEFTESRVIGGEIKPEFCSEILRRWQEHSGNAPEVVR